GSGEQTSLVKQGQHIGPEIFSMGQVTLHQRRSFRQQDDPANGVNRRNIRYANGNNPSAQGYGCFGYSSHCLSGCWFNPVEIEVFWKPDAEIADRDVLTERVVGHGVP